MNLRMFVSVLTSWLNICCVGYYLINYQYFVLVPTASTVTELERTGSLKVQPPIDRKTLRAGFRAFRAVVLTQRLESPGDISMISKELDISAKAKLTEVSR